MIVQFILQCMTTIEIWTNKADACGFELRAVATGGQRVASFATKKCATPSSQQGGQLSTKISATIQTLVPTQHTQMTTPGWYPTMPLLELYAGCNFIDITGDSSHATSHFTDFCTCKVCVGPTKHCRVPLPQSSTSWYKDGLKNWVIE